MSSDTIDRILRYGAGAEFAELYHAVGRLREKVARIAPERLDVTVRRLCECYDHCSSSLDDFEAEIECFKETDNPEPQKGGASPDASTTTEESH